jgi:thiosulfate/3-mercaptopyruvate sulfurtransferase
VTHNLRSLISITEVSELQLNTHCILLDASIPPIGLAPEKIAKETIPGSVFFDIEKDFSDHTSGLPHTLIKAIEFETKARALGINKDSTIIVFDAYGVYSSPRAWWMFKIMGHDKVFVLNGGLLAWKQAGFETTESFAKPEAIGNFVVDFQADLLINKDQIAAQITQPEITIIDARSADRFYGRVDEPRKGLRKGHIPGSINIPFGSLIESGYLRPNLANDFIKNSLPDLAFSCGSGITACIPLLAAYELGYRNLRLYDGSWAEWGADEV